MTAAERSVIGFAQQTGPGTPITGNADFMYVLFRNGGIAVNNVTIPLDPEVGGGAMLRDMVKVGVTSGGALDIIPRPASLGWFLKGALGAWTDSTGASGTGPAFIHTFALPTDQFDAPYFTVRSAPGGIWGEQFQDCRVAGLALTFAGARFLEGAVTFVGGLPLMMSGIVATEWLASGVLDGGPQFLSPVSDIELPSGEDVSVLSGSIAFGLAIPLQEQWIVGSYVPEEFAINQRSAMVTLNLKVTDDDLYNQIVYDPAGTENWLPDIYREGDVKLHFESPTLAEAGVPYALDVSFDTNENNVIWSAAPIALRAGRQVVMQVTGVVVQCTGDPVTVKLTNLVNATGYEDP